jgi:hypothetical protein
VALISDSDSAQTIDLQRTLGRLIPNWQNLTEIKVLGADEYESASQVMEILEQIENLDLIVAERNLKTRDQDLVYGLSNYVDALTQARPEPVLLLPTLNNEKLNKLINAKADILVQTNQLTGANSLINWALRFVDQETTLRLTHIEDDATFERYMSTVERIPQIDTQVARSRIREALLAIPTQYANHVKAKLEEAQPSLPVSIEVRLGHTVADFESLMRAYPVRMLVLNTRVQGQLAMSGMAYVSAVEFKEIPMLLL